MILHLKKVGRLLLQSAHAWSQDNAQRLGASLAFYAIFSLAPLLIVLFAVIGQFYNNIEAKQFVLEQISFWMSESGTGFFQQLLDEVAKPGANHLAFALGSLGIIVGATSLISEIRDVFAIIWGVQNKKQSRWIMAVAARLSFSSRTGERDPAPPFIPQGRDAFRIQNSFRAFFYFAFSS